MNETIKVAGDTYEVNYKGASSVGEWKIADAKTQLIALIPQEVGEEKIKEVMSTNYIDHHWGYFYTRAIKSYCIVLKNNPAEEFGEILSSM